MLKTILEKEQKNIKEKINNLEVILKKYPPENLYTRKNGIYHKWYVKNGDARTYVPKKNKQYLEDLAAKKYYMLSLMEMKEDYAFIKEYLNAKAQDKENAESLFNENSVYKPLLRNKFINENDAQLFRRMENTQDPLLDDTQDLLSGDPSAILPDHSSNQNMYYTAYMENLIHETYNGQMVRSKSEVIIANTLFVNQVAYRYEYPIQLGNVVYHPDFTIIHPKTKKLVYWEHFGMMDDPLYCEKTFEKLKIYTNFGIVPSVDLIATYETNQHPLSSSKVENIVNEYFG